MQYRHLQVAYALLETFKVHRELQLLFSIPSKWYTNGLQKGKFWVAYIYKC